MAAFLKSFFTSMVVKALYNVASFTHSHCYLHTVTKSPAAHTFPH